MAISFPYTARVFLRFRHSDTGLTPTFTYYRRADTLLAVTQPTIHEVSNGTYYFDHSFSNAAAPDIVFEVDGGSSIPTEEVRYISDLISVKDAFLDGPVSQVSADVWADSAVYGAGTKGRRVSNIGDYTDAWDSGTIFGSMTGHRELIRGDAHGGTDGNSTKNVMDRIGDPTTVGLGGPTVEADLVSLDSAITAAVTAVTGVGGPTLSQLGGSGFVTGTDSLRNIRTNLASITPPDNAGISTALAQIAAVLAAVAVTDSKVSRALGMLHENAVLDMCTYDNTTNNLRSARLRIYDSSANAQAAKAAGDGATYNTGLLGQHSIVAEYTGDNMNNYMVVREYP